MCLVGWILTKGDKTGMSRGIIYHTHSARISNQYIIVMTWRQVRRSWDKLRGEFKTLHSHNDIQGQKVKAPAEASIHCCWKWSYSSWHVGDCHLTWTKDYLYWNFGKRLAYCFGNKSSDDLFKLFTTWFGEYPDSKTIFCGINAAIQHRQQYFLEKQYVKRWGWPIPSHSDEMWCTCDHCDTTIFMRHGIWAFHNIIIIILLLPLHL